MIAFAVSCILFFVGAARSCKASKGRAHDIDDIAVELKSTEGSSAGNGWYRLDFEYSVDNDTDADISTISFTTSFFDKDGKNLGSIDSNSVEAKIKEGSKDSLKLSVETYGNNASDLFVRLYNEGLDGLTVKIKVTDVYFEDNYHSTSADK